MKEILLVNFGGFFLLFVNFQIVSLLENKTACYMYTETYNCISCANVHRAYYGLVIITLPHSCAWRNYNCMWGEGARKKGTQHICLLVIEGQGKY